MFTHLALIALYSSRSCSTTEVMVLYIAISLIVYQSGGLPAPSPFLGSKLINIFRYKKVFSFGKFNATKILFGYGG